MEHRTLRRPRLAPFSLIGFLIGLLAGSSAGQEAAAEDPALASHRLLVKVRERTYEDNAQLGRRKLREAKAQLEAKADDDTRGLAELHYGVGLLELMQGNDEAAVEHLENARRLVGALPPGERPSIAERLNYNLGVAYMVLGEDANCVAHHTSQSCILPIGETGVHVDPTGSKKAIEYYARVVDESPAGSDVALGARWLMNVCYMTLGQYPDGVPSEYRIAPSTFTSEVTFPRFVDVAPAVGLNEFSLAGGAAAEDYDLDGDLDVVNSTTDTGKPLLYFQNTGDGAFVPTDANLDGIHGGLNLNQADYDGDGDVDVLVLRGGWQLGLETVHPKSLLQNRVKDGQVQFVDVTFLAGLGEVHYPTQTGAWADYDLDGDLDLYVGNESTDTNRYPGQLFQNQGDGRFKDVGIKAGVANLRFCKGASWGDIDGDRDPDLYLSNYMQPNRLYLNGGDGTFKDVAVERGVDRPFDSFPTWFFDFDNDGALDLYVSSYYQSSDGARIGPVVASHLGLPTQQDLNKLYKNDGQGHFRDVAAEWKVDLFTVVMGANYGDLDNDGFPDFYLGTGYPFYDGLVPNVMYWNRGGKAFADVTFAGGFGHLQKGHGVVFADLDADGDQDVFEDMGGAYPGDAFGSVLFENPGFGNHWLKVRLVGTRSDRAGVGARIRADITEGGQKRSVFAWVTTGASFGCNPLQQHLGLGQASKVDTLEIYWPTSDTKQVFRDVPVDRSLVVTEGKDELVTSTPKPTPFRR